MFLNPSQAAEPNNFVAVYTELDIQFFSQNQVKTKKRSSRLPTSNFPPKLNDQRPPGNVPESVRILKDFHRTPQTAPSNTRGLVEPRLRNTILNNLFVAFCAKSGLQKKKVFALGVAAHSYGRGKWLHFLLIFVALTTN